MNQQTPLRPTGAPPLIWAIVGAFVAVQVAIELITGGYIGGPETYRHIMLNYAFWDLLFEAWRTGEDVPLNMALPPFVTYAFLHGGFLHLAMNSVIFLALGGVILRAVGYARFIAFFLGTAIAGALVFGLLAEARGPMIGASGVVFGFFGIVKCWEWRYIRATGTPANRFWGTIFGLTAINVVLAVLPALTGDPNAGFGSIAWQAHLGGFGAGWVMASVLTPRHAGPSPI